LGRYSQALVFLLPRYESFHDGPQCPFPVEWNDAELPRQEIDLRDGKGRGR
jgi:hypothetical protein